MVHGIDRDWTATLPNGTAGETFPAKTPLPLREAAISTGMRHRSAQKLALTPQWIEALKAEQDAKAFAEDPQNLEKLILTRDRDDHDGAARLQAIESIRGKPPEHSVTWNEFRALKASGTSPGAVITTSRLPPPPRVIHDGAESARDPDTEVAKYPEAASANGYVGPPVAAPNEGLTYDLHLSNGEVRTLPRGFGLIPERKPEPPFSPRLGGRKVQ